jgi:hypothetical protein
MGIKLLQTGEDYDELLDEVATACARFGGTSDQRSLTGAGLEDRYDGGGLGGR